MKRAIHLGQNKSLTGEKLIHKTRKSSLFVILLLISKQNFVICMPDGVVIQKGRNTQKTVFVFGGSVFSNMSVAAMAVSFIRDTKGVESLVMGCETPAQLIESVSLFHWVRIIKKSSILSIVWQMARNL